MKEKLLETLLRERQRRKFCNGTNAVPFPSLQPFNITPKGKVQAM
jgi:hypothetical protein